MFEVLFHGKRANLFKTIMFGLVSLVFILLRCLKCHRNHCFIYLNYGNGHQGIILSKKDVGFVYVGTFIYQLQ